LGHEGPPRSRPLLRLSAGGGNASTSLDDGTDKLEMSGSATDMNFAVGAIVSPNLALHGTLLGWSASDPDLELNGTKIAEINGDVTAAAFGAGLTYYFMPVNTYLSGSSVDGNRTGTSFCLRFTVTRN
jgi:hypothetical protein